MRTIRSLAQTSLLALVLSLPVAQAARAEGPAPALITVTGEGTVQRAPDIATLSLGVTTTGATAAEAMDANTAALNGVLDRLKAAGVAPRDMQTSNLSLNPNWSGYDSASTPRIDGYTAQNQLTVVIRNLDGLGAVLDAAIGDGANTLNGLTFGLAEPDPALDEARKAAVAKARARAELLAGAAGVKVGRIVSISESGGYAVPAPMFRAEASAADAPVPVQGGEVGTTASVTIVWELAQ